MTLFERVQLFIKSEPVAVRTLIALAVTVAARFGLQLNVDEVLSVLGAVSIFMAINTRDKVTPVDPDVVAAKLTSALRGKKGNAL